PRLQVRQRLCSDALAQREGVNDALERERVVRVENQAQERHDVLDLAALVETRAADELVGNAGTDERLFNRPAWSVGAIEDGDVTSIVSRFALQSGDFLDDEARLVVLVKALADDDLGAFGSGGAQGALDALGILANGRVGRREDLGR